MANALARLRCFFGRPQRVMRGSTEHHYTGMSSSRGNPCFHISAGQINLVIFPSSHCLCHGFKLVLHASVDMKGLRFLIPSFAELE